MAGVIDGRWRAGVWAGAAVLLLAPLGLGLVSREMNWGAGDFLAWGAMLLVAALAAEGILRFAPAGKLRWLLGAAVVLGFLLVWAELAVGIFGPE